MPSFLKNTLAKLKHPAAEWSLWLGIPLVLYLTGLHTEVAGGVQRAFLATGLLQPDTRQDTTTRIAANYNLQLQTLDGKKISLRDLKGKVIFLNLWASWCPPCVAEMPNIQKLYQQADSNQVAFVMLTLDENMDKARKFIRRKEYTFPVYSIASDLPAVYGTQSIPTTFVISKDGEIVMRYEGMGNYDTDQFKAFLKSLAAE